LALIDKERGACERCQRVEVWRVEVLRVEVWRVEVLRVEGRKA